MHLPDWLTTVATGMVALHIPTPSYRDWWATAVRLRTISKGFDMNALQLIPAALTLGEDAIKLAQDIQTGDRAGAVAAVQDALPAIAEFSGKPLADLQAKLTPERVGAAYDFLVAVEKVIAAVEAGVNP